jgi:hypothetical protein
MVTVIGANIVIRASGRKKLTVAEIVRLLMQIKLRQVL